MKVSFALMIVVIGAVREPPMASCS